MPVIHIIPEVGSGRVRALGTMHIRLRVVEQSADQAFADSYNNKTTSKLFDPRDIGLKAQNTLDDINCGRYVAAMTIQAAGLAKDGLLPITKENLNVTPAIKRALHFNEHTDAALGLKNAYVKPLSKNPKPDEIIAHYKQVIACLKSEYESRKTNVNREYHGTKVSPFGTGYGTATFFTKAFGFSATEKLKAIDAIENVLDKNGDLDLKKLPKAAQQGRLGECVKEIIKVQDAYRSKMDRGRFGL